MLQSFVAAKTDSLRRLKISNDLGYLKQELSDTKKSMPDCAAESLFRTNKISILTHRIKELEDEALACFS